MHEAERLASAGVAASLDASETLRPPAATLRGQSGAAISVRLGPTGPCTDRQVAVVRAGLRARDFVGGAARVCLDPPDGLLVLIPGTDSGLAQSLACHLRDRLAGFRVTLGIAQTPVDGPDLACALDVARRRAHVSALAGEASGAAQVLPLRQAGLFEERGQPQSGTA
jgi:hypothetical protein